MRCLRLFLAATACGGSVLADDPPPMNAVCREMSEAATRFLGRLAPAEMSRAQFPFADAERENWHFVPRARAGLSVGEMSPEQLAAARELLASALSDRGLLQVDAIVALESVLAKLENRPALRDPGKYFLAIFGEPGPTASWGWRFEGHHVSLNFTLTDGRFVSVTPSFLGANPAATADDRPLAAEEDLARTLAVALHEQGRPVIYSERPPHDILTGADRLARQLDPVGVSGADMTPAQRDALLLLIAQYAGRHRAELAERDVARARAEVERLRFGWAGGLQPGAAYYYRVQGEEFLIEAANVQNRANHIHTVWRDRASDFGRDVLGAHHADHDHDH